MKEDKRFLVKNLQEGSHDVLVDITNKASSGSGRRGKTQKSLDLAEGNEQMMKGNPQWRSIIKRKRDLADIMEVDMKGEKENKKVQFSTL